MIVSLLSLALMGQVPTARPRTPVAFVCSCDDVLSKQYASTFRDALARSVRYMGVSATAKAADGKGDAYEWKILMSTVPNDSDATGIAVSVAVTFDGFYFGNFVQVCGAKKFNECAADVMAEFDDVVSKAK
jgi:hypothetical protein